MPSIEKTDRKDPVRVFIYEPYIFNIYGNTRYLLAIFKHYDRARFSLTLGAPYEHSFLDMVRERGGAVLVVPGPDALNQYGGKILSQSIFRRLSTVCAMFKHSCELARVLGREKVDVVQCHSIRSLLSIGLAARARGIPVFWYVKGDLANGLLDRIGFFLANRILFQSERTRDRCYPVLRKLMKKKIRIVRNAIDLDELDEANEAPRDLPEIEDGERLNIVMIGQVSPLKGTHFAVSAFIELAARFPEIHLYLIGDHVLERYDSYARELETTIRESGISDRIHLLGWRRDVFSILRSMHILVHASLSEGVPKAVLEALAMGIPVVATNVGGTADLVKTGETGVLLEEPSVAAIREALDLLLRDADMRRRCGEAGRDLVRRNHAMRSNIAGLEGVYLELSG